MKKKAVVEIQFNWLFIMIAGIIILMFFITIAGKYKSNAEKELASQVIDKLSAISTSGQMSSDTNTLIDIKDLDLTLDCDPDACNEYGCDTEFDFQEQGVTAPKWMLIEPIFSPRIIKSNYLITWSLDWNMPYKIGSILYLTSPRYRYILVYRPNDPDSEEFAEELYDKLLENKNLNVEMTDTYSMRNIEKAGEVFTKYIFLFKPQVTDTYSISNSVRKSRKWDVLYIEPTAKPMERGTVYFSTLDDMTRRPDEIRKAPYIGLPMLIGAIYSDDYEYYKCNLEKLRMKYSDLNTIYYLKTKSLKDELTGTICEYYYGPDTIQKFDDINSTLENYDTFTGDVGNLWQNADELLDINALALNKDCPRIF